MDQLGPAETLMLLASSAWASALAAGRAAGAKTEVSLFDVRKAVTRAELMGVA